MEASNHVATISDITAVVREVVAEGALYFLFLYALEINHGPVFPLNNKIVDYMS